MKRALIPISLAMLSLASACLPRASGSAGSAQASTPSGSARDRPFARVVVLSIDGLRPQDCLRVPTLKKLAEAGAFAAPPEGALSVLPSVTYPAHTSMVTGRHPSGHGILTNHAPDPDHKNDKGWRWYAEDLDAPTLYDRAFAAGLSTALISWPVTVGARATVLLPEIWRAGTPDDTKLVRALSTEGFFAAVSERYPSFVSGYTPPGVSDEALMDAALTALELAEPALMLVHIFQTDSAQHEHGPDTEGALRALAEADRQVARLLAALEARPEWEKTALVVVSDHGFAPIERTVLVNKLLEHSGLAERVWALANGGTAYFYLKDEGDRAAIDATRTVLEAMRAEGDQGIERLLERDEIARRHGDPAAFLGFETQLGFSVSTGDAAEVIVPGKGRGVHGYLPERPEMRASLIVYGPRIAAQSLAGARLIDVAPTVAAMLGLTLEETDGATLDLTFSEPSAGE